jgi:hypothetical protein
MSMVIKEQILEEKSTGSFPQNDTKKLFAGECLTSDPRQGDDPLTPSVRG